MESNLKDCNVVLCSSNKENKRYIIATNKAMEEVKDIMFLTGCILGDIEYLNIDEYIEFNKAIKLQGKYLKKFSENNPDVIYQIASVYM